MTQGDYKMSEQTVTTTDISAPNASSHDDGNDHGNEKITILRADHERTVKDTLRYKAEKKEADARLKAFEETKLKEQQNWKEYAALKEQEAKEAVEKAERVQNSYINNLKFAAVKDAAMKVGLDPRAISDLELLPLDSVVLETTSTGKLNVLGADQFASSLKTLKPYLFNTVKTNVNTSIPGVTSHEPITKEQILKLSLEAQKTGNNQVYEQAMKQYIQQRK